MTEDALRRENEDLRRTLGAIKILSLQRDLRAIDDELIGYEVDFDNDGPVVKSRCAGRG